MHQKQKSLDTDRYKAFQVVRLLKIRFIRESYYHDWLSNPILVIKPTGKWRTHIDFTNLNKACPKDSFPLPRIDQLVNTTPGHELLSFMDAYFGYNQIPMYEPDEEHASFITDQGLNCYKAMPFDLKNARATCQRLVNGMFKDRIGKSMEVYVNDMLVKSKTTRDRIGHLNQTFNILRKYRIKLNPLKCAFAIRLGKFLGFMVNQCGIGANPDKINALLEMSSPRKPKEVMSLVDRVAALRRQNGPIKSFCVTSNRSLCSLFHRAKRVQEI